MSHTAVPGYVADLVRNGVPRDELRARGDKAVWTALVKTATSAIQHGWIYAEWASYLDEARSTLGRQARIRRDRERSKGQYEKTLRNAWTKAEQFVAARPAFADRDDAIREAHARAMAMTTATGDPAFEVTEEERAVLHAVAGVAKANGSITPAVPRVKLLEETGLGLTALRTALARLADRGLLTVATRGRPAGPTTKPEHRRANTYRLATAEAIYAYLYRGTRSVVPPGQIYGAPESTLNGAPGQFCGAPVEPDNLAGFLKAVPPEKLAAAIRHLVLNGDLAADTFTPPNSDVADVVPIDRRRRNAS